MSPGSGTQIIDIPKLIAEKLENPVNPIFWLGEQRKSMDRPRPKAIFNTAST